MRHPAAPEPPGRRGRPVRRVGLRGRFVLVGVALLTVVLGLLAAAVIGSRELRREAGVVRANEELASALVESRAALYGVQANTRGYAITGSRALLGQWRVAAADLASFTAEIERAASRRHALHARMVRAEAFGYLDEARRVLAGAERHGLEAAQARIEAGEGTRQSEEALTAMRSFESLLEEEIGLQRARAEQRSRRATALAAGAVGFIALTVLAALLYLSRSVVRPVRLLSAHAEALARGDRPPSTRHRGSGEVGDLEDAFEAMASDLDRRLSELDASNSRLTASEERYRLLADNSYDVLVRLDPAGRFAYVSPAAVGVLGWRPEQLVGREGTLFLHPDDVAVSVQTARAAAATREPQVGEYRFRRQDGSHVWVESSGVALFAGDDLEGFQLSLRDITERRRLEAERSLAERRFSSAFGNAPIGMTLVDVEGRFLTVNDALCEITGYRREELLERTFHDITHPDDLDADLNLIRRTLLGEVDSYSLPTRYLRPDGSTVPVELHVSLVRDDAGEPLYFVSQVVDRMAAEAAAAELRSSESRFRTLAESAPVGIYESDAAGSWLYVNPAWCAIAGLEPEQALGDGWVNAIHPGDLQLVLDVWGETAATGTPFTLEYRLRAPDGRASWVAGAAVPRLDAQGRVVGYLGTVHDVTARHDAEAALRDSETNLRAVADAVRALPAAADARQAICAAAVQLAGAKVCTLVERPGSDALVVTASTREEIVGLRFKVGVDVTGSMIAIQTGGRFFAEDTDGAAEQSRILARQVEARSVVYEPVLEGDRAVAALVVGWDVELAGVPTSALNIVGLLAAEAQTALERADLIARLDELAHADGLTGLPNRRTWDEELALEVSRSARNGAPLAVAMIDLDRFKQYNDTQGHQAGDRLLKAAGASWRAALREGDRIMRYGGEEFAVLLHDCDLEAALDVAERLRGATPGGLTCSIGVASWNAPESPDELVARADAALYAAKAAGRNRVHAAA